MRWVTSSGGAVTAATRPAAEALAAEFGMGEIVRAEADPRPRKSAGVRSGPFVVWDDLCQTTRAGDTLLACAQYMVEGDPADHEDVVCMGRNGPMPLNRAERAELQRLMAGTRN